MKHLLRTLLIIDTVILLVFGLFFIASPWVPGLYAPLAPLATMPAMNGQLYGIVLLGLAWLAAHAAFSGALTVAVARVVGHIEWLSAVAILAWLVAFRTPTLGETGNFAGPIVGIVLLLLGLAKVRLVSGVRRRERLVSAGAASAARAEARARADAIPVATDTYVAPPTVRRVDEYREPYSTTSTTHTTTTTPEHSVPYRDDVPFDDPDEPRIPPRF